MRSATRSSSGSRPADCTEQEGHVLISSLLFAADKVANTVGQYDAYLKNLGARSYDDNGRHMVDASAYGRLRLRLPALRFSRGATVLLADMNAVAVEHEADVVYLDPPYNERQYVDCYHVLENIAAWQKPVLSGKTMKFERESLKSDYSRRSTALGAFRKLIERIRARFIFVSYSNEGIIPLAGPEGDAGVTRLDKHCKHGVRGVRERRRKVGAPIGSRIPGNLPSA